jgi:nucleotide-binding universal stress UspA family protein
MKILLRRILVPIDFSDRSRVALTYGVALVEQFKASIHLLHVVESIVGSHPVPIETGLHDELDRAIAARAWDELNELLPSDDRTRLHAELVLEWGTPFVEIVRYARWHEIDLITMGTHGRSGVTHLLMGSVAENVVRTSPCPVLTVRHPEHEFISA